MKIIEGMCEGCSAYKYCGVTISSIKLCKSIHEGFKEIDNQIKEINNGKE